MNPARCLPVCAASPSGPLQRLDDRGAASPRGKHRVDAAAAGPLAALLEDARDAGFRNRISSAYRSYREQTRLFRSIRKAAGCPPRAQRAPARHRHRFAAAQHGRHRLASGARVRAWFRAQLPPRQAARDWLPPRAVACALRRARIGRGAARPQLDARGALSRAPCAGPVRKLRRLPRRRLARSLQPRHRGRRMPGDSTAPGATTAPWRRSIAPRRTRPAAPAAVAPQPASDQLPRPPVRLPRLAAVVAHLSPRRPGFTGFQRFPTALSCLRSITRVAVITVQVGAALGFSIIRWTVSIPVAHPRISPLRLVFRRCRPPVARVSSNSDRP